MGNKYGIYQSTSKSCIFYKQDDDGNQSTFNLFITPRKDDVNKTEIFAFIDNEQMKKDNWSVKKEMNLKEVIEAFGGWVADAPVVFELEACKSISHCLNSVSKNEDTE
jgi:hypothetical protein